jgi:hypothetical protein
MEGAMATIRDFPWMHPGSELGSHASPGPRGLRLEDVDHGSYGDIPAHARGPAFVPRGAAPVPGASRYGHALDERTQVWAHNVRKLYEEALQRQWSSATDIAWEQLKPLPEELERAMCQLCTFLTEVEFIAGDIPGKWMPNIPDEYYEVKLFLSTQMMDEARHLDVFRKRALANGGGLLYTRRRGSGGGVGALGADNFDEVTLILHVLGEGFVQTIFRAGEYIGKSEPEKKIFRMCLQDESRHVAFGTMHLKYLLETQPERREEIHNYLDYVESQLSDGAAIGLDVPMALATLMAGGTARLDEGFKMVGELNHKVVEEYLQRLTAAGMHERRERLDPKLKRMLAGEVIFDNE